MPMKTDKPPSVWRQLKLPAVLPHSKIVPAVNSCLIQNRTRLQGFSRRFLIVGAFPLQLRACGRGGGALKKEAKHPYPLPETQARARLRIPVSRPKRGYLRYGHLRANASCANLARFFRARIAEPRCAGDTASRGGEFLSFSIQRSNTHLHRVRPVSLSLNGFGLSR